VWLFLVVTIFVLFHYVGLEQMLNNWYYLPIYLVFGIFWSIFKHILIVSEAINYVKSNELGKENPVKLIDSKYKIQDRIEEYSNVNTRTYWILFHPISILGYVFGDFLQNIIKKLGIMYDKISDNMIEKNY
jgi:hypothetical protein